jgi:5-methylcytosine-specific restriction endonuclease McrA
MILFISDFFRHLYLKYTGKRVDYDLYLHTPHWKHTSTKAIKRADYKCQVCGTRKYTLNVHHNCYYDNNSNSILYWEKRTDLIVVCNRCHKVIHKYIYVPKENRNVS